MLIKNCVYCGCSEEVREHVIPISYYRVGKRKHAFAKQKSNIVPACKECNCIAGNKVFISLESKREYIQERLEKKYHKILRMPDWSKDELDELETKLRKNTQLKMLAKKWVINRIAFPTIIYPQQPIRAEVRRILNLF